VNIHNDILAFATTMSNSNVFAFSAFSYNNSSLYIQNIVDISTANIAVVGHNQCFFYSESEYPTKIEQRDSIFKSRGGVAPDMNVQ
jgi:hypothetical protein